MSQYTTPFTSESVSADVTSAAGLKAVELLYRVAGSGSEKAEVAVAMAKGAGNTYTATIPAQKAGQIIRFRVRATDVKGAERSAAGLFDSVARVTAAAERELKRHLAVLPPDPPIACGEGCAHCCSLRAEVTVPEVLRLLLRLEQWPNVSGAKRLTGGLAGRFRLRTGDYRVQFRAVGDRVTVEKIGHRDGFYGE